MKDLDNKTKADLEKELDEKRLALKDLRFGTAHSKSRDVKAYSKIRKEIARILTKIRQIK